MKHIKRIFVLLVLVAAAAVFINANTRFFKDISKNVPWIAENFPEAAEFISESSDRINEMISHIPSPREMIAHIRGTELPIDPEDTAYNIYYSSDTMLNFFPKQNISAAVSNGDEIDVYGVGSSDEKYLVYQFLSSSGEVLDQYTGSADSEGKFRKVMHIPSDSKQLAVFTGPEPFGEFSSRIYNYLFLEESSDGVWSVSLSPVYEQNITQYEKPRSISAALKNTYSICSKEPSVSSLASSLTSGISDDYEKALSIHNWVCSNIYYDSDSITGSTNSAPYVASDVIETKRAVCLGYANLYAALCRAADIPCNVVTGYALGVSGNTESEWNDVNINSTEPNHAWNEVYIDNRWIIVDTTWDSHNKIENGTAISDGNPSMLYFDANIRFFSTNHKILNYEK